MSDLNVVAVTGRLGRDPELSYTQSGTAICKLRVAVGRAVERDGVDTDWFDVAAFGAAAEACGQCLRKGALVAVNGRLQVREFEHQGQRRRATEIIANRVEFLSTRREDEGGGAPAPSPQGAPRRAAGGDQRGRDARDDHDASDARDGDPFSSDDDDPFSDQ